MLSNDFYFNPIALVYHNAYAYCSLLRGQGKYAQCASAHEHMKRSYRIKKW